MGYRDRLSVHSRDDGGFSTDPAAPHGRGVGKYDAVNALIDNQSGLVSVRQLREHDVPASAIRWRLGRSWRLAMPGVVQTFTGPLDARRTLVAAALYAGPDATLTGAGALNWYGVRATATDRTKLFVAPRERADRSYGVVTVRRSLLVDPDVRSAGCLRIASPARAVVDAARTCRTQDRADALAIETVQRGLATIADLTHWLAIGNRRGSVRIRTAIEAAATGAWSVPEAELLDLLAASTILPEVWANPVLVSAAGRRLLTPDGWIDEVGLALMVHSRAHHFDVAEWEATVAGDSAYAEHGVTVLAVTPRMIREQPHQVRARVERTYLALRRAPRRVSAHARRRA